MAEILRIGVLGTLEVANGDGPVVIAGGKQRALLAFLAVGAGQEVSAERIVDELWGDNAPQDPPNALQQQVSRLRKAVGDRVVTRATGYLLDVPFDDIDAMRFERLAAEGRTALRDDDSLRAASILRTALELWRGEALFEFADYEWARLAASRLAHIRQGAVEDQLDAALEIGLHADVVGEIEPYLKEYPFSERLWGQLMVALYRCGRQTEALDAFRNAKRLLCDEHGLDPGPELQRLEAAILTQAPELAPRPRQAPGSGDEDSVGGSPPPTNLPALLTSFIGRHEQLIDLQRILRDRRLVTLSGPPGVGKTRLAVELGRAAAHNYRDGVWFISLAPLTEPDGIAAVVAAALGARESAETEPTVERAADPTVRRVVAHLAGRRTLLILDNCEHLLVEVAELVERLLGDCAELTILATSRETLAVPGETQWPVPPLSLPAPDLGEPRELAASEAVRLFEDRAVQVRPSFQVTAETAAAVAEVCSRLDGLPLAIELAAARVKMLPVTHIADALEDRFRLLTAGTRTAPRRQQTLRATIDWSYDLLHADEKRVFETLSVFAGGFALAAAPWMAERIELRPFELVDILGILVDKSLLVPRSGHLGEPRYDMLETLRAYGQEKLTDAERISVARRFHAEYFAEMVEATEPKLYGSEHVMALLTLDGEFENIRAAVQYALGEGDQALAVRIAAALGWFFGMTERQTEGRAWLEAALARPDGLPARATAQAFSYLGFLAGQQRDFDRGIEAGERGLEYAFASEDGWQIALAQTALAGTLRDAGARDRVPALLAQARAGFEAIAGPRGDWGVAGGELIAAREAMRRVAVDEVERASRELMTRARRIGYQPWEILARLFASWLAERRDDPAAATDECDEALHLTRALGLSPLTSLIITLRGRLAVRQGDLDGARTLLQEAVLGVNPVTAPWFAAFAHEALATTMQRLGDVAASEAMHRQVVSEIPALGSTSARQLSVDSFGGDPAARSLIALGTLALERDAEDAQRLQLDGVNRAQYAEDDEAVAIGLEELAATAAHTGRVERAATLLGAAASVREGACIARASYEADRARRTGQIASLALGDTAFEEALARGRALAREDALVAARQG